MRVTIRCIENQERITLPSFVVTAIRVRLGVGATKRTCHVINAFRTVELGLTCDVGSFEWREDDGK